MKIITYRSVNRKTGGTPYEYVMKNGIAQLMIVNVPRKEYPILRGIHQNA